MTAIIWRQGPASHAVNQGLEQGGANPAPVHPFCDIDGILNRPAVGRARTVFGRIGIAGNPAIQFGHQIGQTESPDRVAARQQGVHRGRVFLKRGDAVQHFPFINGVYGGKVLSCRCADDKAGACNCHRIGHGLVLNCLASIARSGMTGPAVGNRHRCCHTRTAQASSRKVPQGTLIFNCPFRKRKNRLSQWVKLN
nr:hypothetical protein [Eilatimonas milleporae]